MDFDFIRCFGYCSSKDARKDMKEQNTEKQASPKKWGTGDAGAAGEKAPFEFTAQEQLRDDSPEDALHLAAATGNLQWINEWEVLAQAQGPGFKGICLNTQNPRTGMAPLHHAAAMGELAMIKRLVDLGAEEDQTDLYGRTPLLIAKRCGHREAYEWIRWRLYNTKRSQFDQHSIPGSQFAPRNSHSVPSTSSFKMMERETGPEDAANSSRSLRTRIREFSF